MSDDLQLPDSLRRAPPTATKKPEATKPSSPNGKSSAAKVTSKPVATTRSEDNVVTLAAICKELKIDSTVARAKLRAAVTDKKIKHAAKSAWTWPKGSPELKTVRALLKD